LKTGKPKSNQAVIQNSLLTLAFNRYLAIGYWVKLKTGESIDLPSPTMGYLLVSQGDATIQYRGGNSKQQRFMKAGHYIWIQPGEIFSLTNSSNPANFMLLQLKWFDKQIRNLFIVASLKRRGFFPLFLLYSPAKIWFNPDLQLFRYFPVVLEIAA